MSDTFSFSLTISFYRDGQGSYRFKGNPSAPGQPPAIKDVYIEKFAMGGRPPRKARVAVEWDHEGSDDAEEIRAS